MTFPAIFAIVVGIEMIGQWTASYLAGGIPELKSEPYRIAFHLVGEFATAVLLLVSGSGLIFGWPAAAPLYLVAAGMLLYTAIVSPGYFVQQGQPIWLLLFGIVLLLTVVNLVIVVQVFF